MDFNLSQEHLMLRDLYRKFAENEVKPLAEEVDEEERFPMETVKKLARYGFMGIPFPTKYGGAGGDILAYAMAVEELSKCCATTGVIVSAHTSLCCAPIFENGTEEQKMKYLPALLSGEKIGAFGLTEPGAGTDAAGQQTTVEKDFPGFSVGKKEKKMGIRGSATCELIMENCIVPKENLLGKEGKGFAIAMKTLDGGRIGIASQALGIGEGAVEETIKYVQERKQFGKRLSQMQNTQFQLADMHTRMKAAQFLVYSAACKKQAYVEAEMAGKKGESYSADAAMAKLFAAEAASDVTRRAVQLYGGYGYTREYPVERMMRDAKITEIYEGTSEVQRMVIAANLGVK